MKPVIKNEKVDKRTNSVSPKVNVEVENLDENYKTYINDLAKNDKNVVFYNSGPKHAAFVLANIFNKSTDEIKIFNGGFKGAISSDPYYRANLFQYIFKGGKLKILCNEEGFKNEDLSQMFKLLLGAMPDSIQIKKTKARVFKNNETEPDKMNETHEVHFTVGDEKMYRIEDDVSNYSAVCNFNDPIQGEKLSKLFDEIYNDPDSELTNI